MSFFDSSPAMGDDAPLRADPPPPTLSALAPRRSTERARCLGDAFLTRARGDIPSTGERVVERGLLLGDNDDDPNTAVMSVEYDRRGATATFLRVGVSPRSAARVSPI